MEKLAHQEVMSQSDVFSSFSEDIDDTDNDKDYTMPNDHVNSSSSEQAKKYIYYKQNEKRTSIPMDVVTTDIDESENQQISIKKKRKNYKKKIKKPNPTINNIDSTSSDDDQLTIEDKNRAVRKILTKTKNLAKELIEQGCDELPPAKLEMVIQIYIFIHGLLFNLIFCSY